MKEDHFPDVLIRFLEQHNKLLGAILVLVIAGCIALRKIPCLIPVVLLFPLMFFVDRILRKLWDIPEQYEYNAFRGQVQSSASPVSVGWLILTGVEAVIAFFILLIYMFDGADLSTLWGSLIIYIVLSFIILRRKYNKIQKWKMAGMESVGYDETGSDSGSSVTADAKPWQDPFLSEEEKPWQTEEYFDWDGTEEDDFDEEELPSSDDDFFAEENEKPADSESCSGIPFEELKKLKELLDMEIITPEEFEAKKKQMLGL